MPRRAPPARGRGARAAAARGAARECDAGGAPPSPLDAAALDALGEPPPSPPCLHELADTYEPPPYREVAAAGEAPAQRAAAAPRLSGDAC